jgi:hypothetical protein
VNRSMSFRKLIRHRCGASIVVQRPRTAFG